MNLSVLLSICLALRPKPGPIALGGTHFCSWGCTRGSRCPAHGSASSKIAAHSRTQTTCGTAELQKISNLRISRGGQTRASQHLGGAARLPCVIIWGSSRGRGRDMRAAAEVGASDLIGSTVRRRIEHLSGLTDRVLAGPMAEHIVQHLPDWQMWVQHTG